jgi:hypothetical protein
MPTLVHVTIQAQRDVPTLALDSSSSLSTAHLGIQIDFQVMFISSSTFAAITSPLFSAATTSMTRHR